MGYIQAKNWYLTNPQAISRYLVTIIKNWDYHVFWNRSDDSESVYLKVCVGTVESPKALHIRISDHSLSGKNLNVLFDLDVYSSYQREGAISYIKLLSNLSQYLNKPLPAIFKSIKNGTKPYKNYTIEMQRRKKLANSRQCFFQDDRLYI